MLAIECGIYTFIIIGIIYGWMYLMWRVFNYDRY